MGCMSTRLHNVGKKVDLNENGVPTGCCHGGFPTCQKYFFKYFLSHYKRRTKIIQVLNLMKACTLLRKKLTFVRRNHVGTDRIQMQILVVRMPGDMEQIGPFSQSPELLLCLLCIALHEYQPIAVDSLAYLSHNS